MKIETTKKNEAVDGDNKTSSSAGRCYSWNSVMLLGNCLVGIIPSPRIALIYFDLISTNIYNDFVLELFDCTDDSLNLEFGKWNNLSCLILINPHCWSPPPRYMSIPGTGTLPLAESKSWYQVGLNLAEENKHVSIVVRIRASLIPHTWVRQV